MSAQRIAMPSKFIELSMEANAHNELNDCSVKAISVVTGAPYAEVRTLLEKYGRKTGKGAWTSTMDLAIKALGFKIRTWQFIEHRNLIATYSPKATSWYHGLTTKQVRAYNKKWRALPCQNMLLFSSAHVSAYQNGEVIDWAHDKAKRIYMVWEVTKA